MGKIFDLMMWLFLITESFSKSAMLEIILSLPFQKTSQLGKTHTHTHTPRKTHTRIHTHHKEPRDQGTIYKKKAKLKLLLAFRVLTKVVL